MSCCSNDQKFDGASGAYRRALWAVICINLAMFVVEITAGFASGSQALKADALDFAGDTLTYAISLLVIGSSLAVRALTCSPDRYHSEVESRTFMIDV